MAKRLSKGTAHQEPNGDGATNHRQPNGDGRRGVRAGERGSGGAGRSRPLSPLRLLLGPGMLIAVAASAVLWPRLPHVQNAPSGPPRIERTGTAGSDPAPPPGAPDPAWLTGREGELGLDPAQANRLRSMRARWDRETRALRQAIDRESSRLNQALAPPGLSKEDPRITMNRIRELAGPVTELSRQLMHARRAWWDEASTVLSPSQRRQAERLWAAHLRGEQDRRGRATG